MHKAASALFGSQLRRNVIAGMASSILGAAIMAIAYRVYLQQLGWDVYGLWLVLSMVITLTQLGSLGLSPAIAREVARERAAGTLRSMREAVTTAMACLLASGLATTALAYALAGQIGRLLGLQGANLAGFVEYLPWVGLMTVYALLLDGWTSILTGLGRADAANACQVFGQFVCLAASVVLLRHAPGIPALLIGALAGYVALHGIAWVWVRRTLGGPALRYDACRLAVAKRLLRFGAGMFGSSALTMLIAPFNKIVLTRAAGLASVPVFEISFNSAMRLRAFFESGVRAILPEVSAAAEDAVRGHCRIQNLRRKALWVLVGSAIPVFLAIWIAARPALALWLGSAFQEGLAPAFRIAIIAALLSLAGVPGFYVLLGLGRSARVFAGNVLQSGVNVAGALAAVALCFPITAAHVLVATCFGVGAGSLYLVYASAHDSLSLAS